jgi:hypothetical protein
LRLADDERIQARRDAEQMARGLGAAQYEDVRRDGVPRERVVLGDEVRARVGRDVGVGRRVNLGAIARRNGYGLASNLRATRARVSASSRAREVDPPHQSGAVGD